MRTWNRRTFLRAGVAVAGGAALGGCYPEPTAPEPNVGGGARLSARPGSPSGEPTIGAEWLDINPTGRDARLYVPPTYDPSTPAPLLVTLHGRGGSALDWDAFHDKCDARDMVMLAIDSRGVTWDLLSGSYGADVTYIDQALGMVFDRCAIDPGRVALAGFSDGASYALSLGPTNGDLFPQVIAFSPGFAAPALERYGAPRIWISHGRSDAILSSQQTEEVIVPGLLDLGYFVTYVPFEVGHEVPAAISNEALDWLLA
jgi:predicted esterase